MKQYSKKHWNESIRTFLKCNTTHCIGDRCGVGDGVKKLNNLRLFIFMRYSGLKDE